ncbi:DEAD/DEAH box helicase [Antrihabitans cavernicola]|uniref:DEAD/DEAH box helicase n=1 Tax=Antrihabitans cavernicola TaxID=2495913 RepID=UPI0035300097
MTNAVQDTAVQDNAVHETAAPTTPEITFTDLGLPDALVNALSKNSITVPSPIQAKALPDALAGRNVLGRAQTGSGKTLAFGLPMLTRLARHTDRPAAKRPRALVLVPTRELAFQVVESLGTYAGALGLTVRPAVGGTPFGKQADQLRRGVDILVATPGRLGDHLRQGTAILDAIEITALDEADQMADMGFLPEVRSILGDTRDDGQRLLFSATLDREVQSLVRQFLPDHVQHSTADGRASVNTMDHYVLLVDRGNKDKVLAEIGARSGGRTIMFARTKLGCEGITDRLRAVGIAAESLHGGKAQNQRTRVLERFKNGRTPVLVATDVAARGIHVDGIDLVVHVDPPADHKDYLHRAGRTARAGEKGTVVAIVLPNQRNMMRKLTSMAGVKTTPVPVAPGSDQLASITGAQQPTGEPLRQSASYTDRRNSFDGRSRPPRREGGGGYRGNAPREGGYRGGDSQRSEGGYRGQGGPRRESAPRDGGFRAEGRPERRDSSAAPRTSGGFRARTGDSSYGGFERRSNRSA